MIDKANCIEQARARTVLPDGTKFTSFPVLLRFLATWRSTHGSAPFFRWHEIDGYSVAQRFPVAGELDRLDLSAPRNDRRAHNRRALGDAKGLEGMLGQAAGRPWPELVQLDWGKPQTTDGSTPDFFLLGAFAQRSPFAEISLSGAELPKPATMEKVLQQDPALTRNRDGSLTLSVRGRRTRMVGRLEKQLQGAPLRVFRKQANHTMILVQLLRSFGTPAFGSFRAALLQEFRDKLRSLDQCDWVEAIKGHIRAEYDGHLRGLSSPRLSDRRFLSRAFKALNRAPYLFTTPSMAGVENFSVTGTSGAGFSEYEIDLASLPRSYKRRIFIAPDGTTGAFHVEVDFPWRNLRDALTFARAIRRVDDRHSDMY